MLTHTLKRHLTQLTLIDWLWAVSLTVGTVIAQFHYHHYMDIYEQLILITTALGLIGLGIHWKATRMTGGLIALLTLTALGLYQNNIARAEEYFMLKYFLASQSLISWMCTLYFLSTGAYLIGLLRHSDFANHTASKLCWTASIAGVVSLLVRWRESYLIDFDFGHIPVSNLYEVFVLFCITTGFLYLYYEHKFKTYQLGFFCSMSISLAALFILWYGHSQNAAEIQPLVPALQSYWMKIHVPANFIGYGAFSLAAMLAVAWLLADWQQKHQKKYVSLPLPQPQLIDTISYKVIALGFTFFTLATVLGALWAAEAWGSYWSWDPKETWALIVWLNYAAWLHFRLVHGWNGKIMAWWSIAGYFITLFCFLGVNMFLSGLHSYGEL